MQFETIHPFLDGNGRAGRLLITLILIDAGLLQYPLLYLSLHFKQHRPLYYELLGDVRRNGDWEKWLTFFFDGVEQTAKNAASTAQALLKTFEADHKVLKMQGRLSPTLQQVHFAMQRHPVFTGASLVEETKLTMPTVNRALKIMMELEIVVEVTGRKRDRLFAYAHYLRELNKGTEPFKK